MGNSVKRMKNWYLLIFLVGDLVVELLSWYEDSSVIDLDCMLT